MSSKAILFLILFLPISIISLTVLYISGYLSLGTGISSIIMSALVGWGTTKLNELEGKAKRKQNNS
ncbi:hypothetical protein [Gracilibacillus alcaliphilus]|uniref:hypothetical protein n=1 Tax=Gracilibacillus alcaliphilus TaxID=1401441 RepID=UPI00195D4D2F|nr:hypothetical protein [Gracilibacillus alcaliphilus]MBM7675693.1 hypothetical protein [Gracilibacillus alcaliphilus]